ncbi:RhuM family protein [Herbaspirillum sp. VT-16-41]|uniref:RhuM family protein n=1 Tax=Herbaspirillum sp. VT-16-41 TaxID=1953765 RepID=UPI0020C36767|nr:RhuM family protein [Herbaspirillum sp. VT-16-41]
MQIKAVVKEDLTTAADGKRYRTQLYNLDMILAIGYRVKSPRGTQFRQWATTHLKQYLIKGFVMDDERLKGGDRWDYFGELLERIRDIRLSEKRFYLSRPTRRVSIHFTSEGAVQVDAPEGASLPEVKQAMRSQWGSCSPKGEILLNPHLVKAPRPCIEYVLAHELCHLREHNHSDRFYRLLSRVLQDWEARKAELDGLAELLLNR